jgi:poly(hydroxyalkanoate) depolymerase family esterase
MNDSRDQRQGARHVREPSRADRYAALQQSSLVRTLKPLRSFLARFRLPMRVSGLRPPAARGRDGVASPTIDINDTIERALSAAGLRPHGIGERPGTASRQAAPAPASAPVDPPKRSGLPQVARRPARYVAPASANPDTVARGVSLERVFGNAAGTRAYTLYVPAGHPPDTHAALPLVLMLHGCTQDPADFAAGTRMNALADRHGVLVAYPAQAPRDNGSRCWNWFRRQDQRRDGGEPSILAGIVAHVAADHRVDARRVYVAGLSAGAAMAVILGRTYPDVFAAVGAHSGLPFGAAHDVASAFQAMHGAAGVGRATEIGGIASERRAGTSGVIPTIVFHGDADRTVHQDNGTAIVHDTVAATATPLAAQRIEAAAGGRRHTRKTFVDAEGRSMVEHWVLHGAGHAWSGGDPAGSHVDPLGPDASAEMLRFFLQHAQSGA